MSGRTQISLTGIPNIGRATLLGGVIGWIVVAVPVLIGMLALGAPLWAIVFASHVGSFGGMGFGGMLGAVMQADRFERTEAAAKRTVRSSARLTTAQQAREIEPALS